MVNKDWCHNGKIHFLSKEFTAVIITAVYIPPQASTEAALSDLCKDLKCSQTGNPDAALIVAGDVSQTNLNMFHQHIDCTTSGINTLDHSYTPFKTVTERNRYLCSGRVTMRPSPSV